MLILNSKFTLFNVKIPIAQIAYQGEYTIFLPGHDTSCLL